MIQKHPTPVTRIQQFKHELARVFDDNLHTKQWHNYVDYAIMGLIFISTLEVFLSTFSSIAERYSHILYRPFYNIYRSSVEQYMHNGLGENLTE